MLAVAEARHVQQAARFNKLPSLQSGGFASSADSTGADVRIRDWELGDMMSDLHFHEYEKLVIEQISTLLVNLHFQKHAALAAEQMDAMANSNLHVLARHCPKQMYGIMTWRNSLEQAELVFKTIKGILDGPNLQEEGRPIAQHMEAMMTSLDCQLHVKRIFEQTEEMLVDLDMHDKREAFVEHVQAIIADLKLRAGLVEPQPGNTVSLPTKKPGMSQQSRKSASAKAFVDIFVDKFADTVIKHEHALNRRGDVRLDWACGSDDVKEAHAKLVLKLCDLSLKSSPLHHMGSTTKGNPCHLAIPQRTHLGLFSPVCSHPRSISSASSLSVKERLHPWVHGGLKSWRGSASTALASASFSGVVAPPPTSFTGALAQFLGYLVGAGSLLLYSPIIVRVVRQGADGLTLYTWWLNLFGYSASIVYRLSRGFPLSTFIETYVMSLQAGVLLLLIAAWQNRLFTFQFAAQVSVYIAVTVWALLAAPPETVAFAQAISFVLTNVAIVPQIRLNAKRKDPGGYSPLTAALGCIGLAIRLFTTQQLAGGDALLVLGFASGLLLNGLLLGQILYYGTIVQGISLAQLLTGGLRGPEQNSTKTLP